MRRCCKEAIPRRVASFIFIFYVYLFWLHLFFLFYAIDNRLIDIHRWALFASVGNARAMTSAPRPRMLDSLSVSIYLYYYNVTILYYFYLVLSLFLHSCRRSRDTIRIVANVRFPQLSNNQQTVPAAVKHHGSPPISPFCAVNASSEIARIHADGQNSSVQTYNSNLKAIPTVQQSAKASSSSITIHILDHRF